ncbi:MAG TPA: endonuclease/exonuclease/phosphatase family protein, partial [Candidatus Eisenbacteria bacterium]|nr:endonuclease/exonuclease/phosphatase family protein [Candidatus Eisenbacteria bacterium]
MFKGILAAAGVVFILATALPLSRSGSAWVRIFDFPRTQIAVGGFLVAVLYCFFVWDIRNVAEHVMLALLAGCVLFQAYRIFPYTVLAAPQVQASSDADTDASFSLLISNVLMENRNLEQYLEIVGEADPDLLLAVETDRWWTEQLRVLDGRYPDAVKYPLANCYGMLLYSRLKLIEPQIKFLIEDDVPSIHTRVELKSGDSIVLHCLHPKPPQPVHSRDSTER